MNSPASAQPQEPADFYVYLIRRPCGAPCYVGKGRGDRCHHHAKASHNRYLARIYAKHGDAMTVEKMHEGLESEAAFALEVQEIARIGRLANGGPLVNMTDGGDGVRGHKRTPEQRAAMSAARKGRRVSPEAAAKVSAALKGRPKSPEHCAAVSAAKRGVRHGPMSQAQRDAIGNSHRGRKRSAEECASIRAGHAAMSEEARALKSARVSAALMGKGLSPEHRAKISMDQRGRVRSPEFKAKVSAGMKAYRAAQRAGTA